MDPMTRSEIFMAAAAGEYDGDPPAPVTRSECYWQKIIARIEGGASVDPDDINAAIADYLNTHDADIVTEAELARALGDYTTTADLNTALSGKADTADIPDVSSFIDADVDNLANYYDKDDVDSALAGKAAADHNHSGVYAPASHTHVQADITGLAEALNGKAATVHTHDDRYYTKTETDTALSGKQNTLTFDSTPTENSDNPVKSGGVYTAIRTPTAFSHNCFFRGKNLGTVSAGSIDAFISDHGISTGDFTDIYVGDFFTASYNRVDTVFRVAGFNLYQYTGNPALTDHHIVVVPDYQLTTGAMNSTDTTAGGYVGSDMFTTVIGGSTVTSGVNKNLYDIFGTHLLKYKDQLSCAMSTDGKSKAVPMSSGVASNQELTDVYANLLSGSHLWGEASGASSVYDYGIQIGQFPLFRYEPKYIISRNAAGSRPWYWLRNITNSISFSSCSGGGNPYFAGASSTGSVRPFFLLG